MNPTYTVTFEGLDSDDLDNLLSLVLQQGTDPIIDAMTLTAVTL